MNQIKEDLQVATTVSICPFCAGRGYVIMTLDKQLFGVRCGGCQVFFPERFQTCQDAVAAWCLRRGTSSALGGAATAGVRSRRKLRAAKKNLRKARDQKQLKRIRAAIEVMVPLLREARRREIAKLEGKIAQERAWLQQVEPLLIRDPRLNELRQLLKQYQRRREKAGDSPANSESCL